MHILITGAIGVGKSTLLRRITEELGDPASHGFYTKKRFEGADSYTYIHAAKTPERERFFDERNRVGICATTPPTAIEAAFNDYGVSLLTGIPQGSFVTMDEIGFLETKAEPFRNAVSAVFDGHYTVLGVVKPLPLPFLAALREREDARLFVVTPETREAVTREALAFVRTAFKR